MSARVSNNFILDKISSGSKKTAFRPEQRPQKAFREVLDSLKGEVKISKHAMQRLEMRNVKLSEEQIKKLGTAMDRAGEKGVKDALIMLDGNALVASVANRTIVTAAKQEDLETRIITNIDGAIVL